MELAHLEDIHLDFFYLVINKLMRGKMQNIFSLIAEYFDFIKYSLSKLD